MYVPIAITSWCEAWKEWGESEEKYAELRELIPHLPKKYPSYGGPDFWATTQDMAHLADLGIDFQLKKEELLTATGTMIVKMQDRLDQQFPDGHVGKARAMATGNAVQIAIPDLGLLVIDEVTWIEDACTQELQSHLEDGWRILAVCPPNAKRRPDYILGRTKSN